MNLSPRGAKRGVNLISDALPFGRLWYGGPNAVANKTGYAEHRSRSHDAVIGVYDDAGNVIQMLVSEAKRKAASTVNVKAPLLRQGAGF